MSLVATYEIEYLQYLGADGRLLGEELPEFARDRRALGELLKQMLYIRTFDTKAVALQRTGTVGSAALSTAKSLLTRAWCSVAIVVSSTASFTSA